MTKASPMATTAMIVEEKSRFSILIRLKNTGLATPNNMLQMTMTTTRPRSSRISTMDLLPVRTLPRSPDFGADVFCALEFIACMPFSLWWRIS